MDLATYRMRVQPILREACVGCHGPDAREGNVRIDTLNPDLVQGDDVSWWLEVFAVLSNGEMPPPDDSELTDADRTLVVEWLANEIQRASSVRRAKGGHSSFRRMTKYEFNYALQDILGLPFDFARDLPPEAASEDGFFNSAETLHMTVNQLATYRDLSRRALGRAIVQGDRPKPLYWQITMADAAAEVWGKYETERAAIRQRLEGDPEQLDQELERHAAQHRQSPRNAHYRHLATGWSANVSWNYRNAKFAWSPSDQRLSPPGPPEFVAVLPPRQRLIVELGDQLPERGTMRVRFRASWSDAPEQQGQAVLGPPDKHPPSLQLEFGWQASNDSSAAVRVSDRDLVIDAPPNEPKFYQWDVALGEIYPRNLVRHTSKMGQTPSPSEFIKFVNSSVSQGDIQIDCVQVVAPVYERWPPASHDRIFSDQRESGDSTASESESERARKVLQRFMSRAWRRKATLDELSRKMALFNHIRPSCDTLEEAISETLATVLSSPNFLYLGIPVADDSKSGLSKSGPGREGPDGEGPNGGESPLLSQHELATRLSIFLWCSVPDDELLELAGKGRLADPRVLDQQVSRMLGDSRSRRFSQHFVRQWLGMQLLDYLNVDRKLYRQFDPALKEAMQEEPVAFFHEVLEQDGAVLDFIHADYTMANERLARHYGVQGIGGNHFRRVSLAPEHRRGGLLTQAGLLAMNSDGKDSHPLKRGIWLLESLLNDPPPPPPPAVPEIDLADPRIAEMSLKERIADHRNQPACRSCHAKIDPWGIAFENFDAVGSWRVEYDGKPVDAASTLFNNQKLDGMDGLKRYLLEHRQDQFTRALVHKLTTYALGRPLTFGDRSSVDRLTAEVRSRGDGLATMVRVIVASDLFQSP